mmetsp:Transcript_15822/g.47543  ORF Transcript_15822/g.47543 Transcript_15822/m.47543 type:complete len:223 (+) Transcript_15822:65-733(+)
MAGARPAEPGSLPVRTRVRGTVPAPRPAGGRRRCPQGQGRGTRQGPVPRARSRGLCQRPALHRGLPARSAGRARARRWLRHSEAPAQRHEPLRRRPRPGGPADCPGGPRRRPRAAPGRHALPRARGRRGRGGALRLHSAVRGSGRHGAGEARRRLRGDAEPVPRSARLEGRGPAILRQRGLRDLRPAEGERLCRCRRRGVLSGARPLPPRSAQAPGVAIAQW